MAAGTIQGVSAGSVNEWNVAQALDRLKMPYRYQVPIYGGRRMPGGQVVDFLVEIPPKPIPLYVQGQYWHRQANEMADFIKQIKAGMIPGWADPLLIWEKDCMTVDQAVTWLKAHLL